MTCEKYPLFYNTMAKKRWWWDSNTLKGSLSPVVTLENTLEISLALTGNVPYILLMWSEVTPAKMELINTGDNEWTLAITNDLDEVSIMSFTAPGDWPFTLYFRNGSFEALRPTDNLVDNTNEYNGHIVRQYTDDYENGGPEDVSGPTSVIGTVSLDSISLSVPGASIEGYAVNSNPVRFNEWAGETTISDLFDLYTLTPYGDTYDPAKFIDGKILLVNPPM